MKVWIVTEEEWSCDSEGNEEISKEVIGVFDTEEKAKEECSYRRVKANEYCGNWEYDYEEFEVK